MHTEVNQDGGAAMSGEQPDLVVSNIGQLLTMVGPDLGVRQGPGLALACRGPTVLATGSAQELFGEAGEPAAGVPVLDAGGGLVTPGLVDPHTHPVFAGQRAVEFGLKARGASYMEIHKAGGGILSTVEATRAASFEELVAGCRANLDRLLRWGVTTCEGKSGYALTVAGELRMLEVIQATASHPVEVIPTLLGAHTLPPEYAEDRAGYLELVTREMIPRAAAAGLARFCDAYCEDGAFTTEEVERIFTVALEHGLGLRLHAEQFTDQGGAVLAARLGAASADHLEAVSPEGISAMALAGTTAVLLPGAALACRCPWPPARAILDGGVNLALGTDLNPGSSMTSSLPLMMSLACMQMGVTVEEAWRAVTINAARSLGLEGVGTLTPGAQADLVIWDAPDYRYIPYHYGDNHVNKVIKQGKVVL